MGLDKLGLFEPGVVYEGREILGEIVFTPVGEYALPESGGVANRYSEANDIIRSGLHIITQDEIARAQQR